MIDSMKRLLNRTYSEKGSVLILTLIMTAITLAIILALVAVMATGNSTGIMYNQKNNELYTADAGVQDAIALIIFNLENSMEMPTSPYTLSDKYGADINDIDARVSISPYIRDGIQYYKIFSEGRTEFNDQRTTITTYINAFDAWGWVHSQCAFTSPETLDFRSGTGGTIEGGAHLPQGYTGQGEIDTVNYDPILGWPDRNYFIDYYTPQVSGSGIPGGVIEIAEDDSLTVGMINQMGDLIIRPQGTGNLTLEDDADGTVWYIHGDLIVERLATQGVFDIFLNGQTIFIEGKYIELDGQSEFIPGSLEQETNSGNKIVQFQGPGVIIAVGDISFAPAAAVNPDGTPDMERYIYVLSIEGAVNIWPRGAFVGSIAARKASTIQPSTEIYFYEDPNFGGLNLPSSGSTGTQIVIGDIESWIIDDPVGNSGISITPYWLPYGEISYPYSQTLQASGGTEPYTWSLTSGTLPEGLSLSSSGIVSGTPIYSDTRTYPDKHYFTVQATDNSSPPKTGKQAVVITVNELPLILTDTLLLGKVGELYSEFINWQGGTPTFTWSISSGVLPPGLELLTSTGNIVGTPTLAGTYNFTVRLTDNYGATASMPLSLTITLAAP